MVTLDPQRLQSYAMSPDEVVTALVKGNSISPSGNVPIGDKYPIVPVNSVVKDPLQLGTIPIRTGDRPYMCATWGMCKIRQMRRPVMRSQMGGGRFTSWRRSELMRLRCG